MIRIILHKGCMDIENNTQNRPHIKNCIEKLCSLKEDTLYTYFLSKYVLGMQIKMTFSKLFF